MKALSYAKALVFLLCLGPLARLIALGLMDELGANPIEVVTRSTGTWAMVFLWIALAVTPLRHWTGWHVLLDVRRMIGLFSAFYALLHLTTYLWFDQFFDWMAIGHDILKRPFITLGMGAIVLMLPLAITSTDRMVRALGARRWVALHKLTYAAAVLAACHYIWLVKRDLSQPLIYAGVLLLRLFARLPLYLQRRARRSPARRAGPAAGSSVRPATRPVA